MEGIEDPGQVIPGHGRLSAPLSPRKEWLTFQKSLMLFTNPRIEKNKREKIFEEAAGELRLFLRFQLIE